MDAKFIAKYLYNYRRRHFFIGVLILICCICSMAFIQIDGNLSGNIVKQSSFFQAAENIKQYFKLDDVIQVKVVPARSQSLSSFMSNVEELINNQKKEFPSIGHSSIIDFKHHFYLENVSPEEDVLSALIKLKKMPFLTDLISRDLKSIQVLFNVKSNFKIKEFDKVLNQKYNGILEIKPLSRFHIEKSVAGFIASDLSVLSILMIILSFIVLLLTFKKVNYILGCLAFLFIGVTCSISSFAIFGIKINIITILVIPIVIVLTLSDIVHLLSGVRFSTKRTNKEIISESIEQYIIPSFLTSLTTAIAFASFGFSEIPNMREFGIVSCSGVIITFIMTFLMSPYLFDRFLNISKIDNFEKVDSRFLDRILSFIFRSRKYFLALFLCSFVFSLFVIRELDFKTSSAIFFPKGSDIHSVHDELNKDFNSLLSLDVLVSPPVYPDIGIDFKWDKTAITKQIYLLTKQFSSIEKVQSVSSVGMAIEYFYDNGFTFSDWQEVGYVNSFLASDKHLVRIWFENADDVQEAYPEVVKALERSKHEIRYEVSSVVLLNKEVDLFLSRNIFTSLLTSALLILLILYYLSSSLRVTLVCFLVNILPLSFIVSVFYVFQFDLNLITAMCSVICIGIIVDDTIHVVYRWKNGRDLVKLSYGMLTTSIILALGFGMFSFSNFRPSQVLGVTCGLTFVLAVISDIIILPWLLDRYIPKEVKNVS